jgi:iron-sulfur cluster repair protein YtfE (RIC family)
MADQQSLDDSNVVCELREVPPRQVVAEISSIFREPTDAMIGLRERIDWLAEQLSRRFASEEQSGRYDDALCRAPWLTARAQELQQQHQQLTDLLNGLQSLCQSSEGLVAWWQRLRQDFAEFAELLEEHEAAENNLLDDMHPGPSWSQD